MILSLSKQVSPINDVIINHEKIKKVSSTKFLVILLDNNLSWSQNIYYVLKTRFLKVLVSCIRQEK